MDAFSDEIVYLLLESYADIFFKDGSAGRVLWLATSRGKDELVEHLIELDINHELSDENFKDSMDLAKKNEFDDIYRILKKGKKRR